MSMLSGNIAALLDTQVGWIINENTSSFISKWLKVCSLCCYAATFNFKQTAHWWFQPFCSSSAVTLHSSYRLSFLLSIKQNQHQTEFTPTCEKNDLKTVFFWCFQLGTDNIICSDPTQIKCEWRLTSVSQYKQMAARQGSLVVIIHVQDLWLRQHHVAYTGFQNKNPSVITSEGAFLAVAVGQM